MKAGIQSWLLLGVFVAGLLIGGAISAVGGFGANTPSTSSRYCYVTGSETNDGGNNFVQQYHATCSTAPLPQNP